MPIDRNDYTPLYMQFYQLLKQEISSYSPGTMLPPERFFCEKYELDRVTVRKAMAMLAEEGFIERRQGRGTTVLSRNGRENNAEKGVIMFALYDSSHLLDRIGEPFYAHSMDELEAVFHKMNEQLVYSKIPHGSNLPSLCRSLSIKSIILAGRLDAAVMTECAQLNIPIVTYNCCHPGFSYVVTDNENGARMIAEHFLSLGHRRIGFIHVPGHTNSIIRLNRFRCILREHGLPDPIIAEGDWSEKSGYNAGLCLLSDAENRPTAIFAGNDSMAFGVLRAAEEKALRVPEDISVAGYDGIQDSSQGSPALTTFQTNIPAMAEATRMLLSHVNANGKNPDIGVVISGKLLERASTGPAPQ